MRESKFRGLDTNGRWIYGNLVYMHGVASKWTTGIQQHSGENMRPFWSINVDRKTVGEYTGITDSKGNDLYEGDIVQITDQYGDSPTIHWIEYQGEQGYPAFELEPDIGFDSNGLSYAKDTCIIERIGNVHENPELLKEGEIK